MCNIINLRIANVNILTVNGQEHFFHLDLTESWEQINIPVISVSTMDGAQTNNYIHGDSAKIQSQQAQNHNVHNATDSGQANAGQQ